MRLNFRNPTLAISLLLCLAVPRELSAQHTVRYKLVEFTLGGPISYYAFDGDGARLLNKAGVVSSSADTTLADPFAGVFCFNPDCLLANAYRWRNGVMTDLGSLVNDFNSAMPSLNDRGGVSVHRKRESLTMAIRNFTQHCGWHGESSILAWFAAAAIVSPPPSIMQDKS